MTFERIDHPFTRGERGLCIYPVQVNLLTMVAYKPCLKMADLHALNRTDQRDGIMLTPDETSALAEILGMLATIEERGLAHDDVIEISRQLWRDILLRPAARLQRIAPAMRIRW